MLLQIGKRQAPESAVEMLLACHDRIRHFISLSFKIATVESTAGEIRESAAQILRYFEEAFPLHQTDEEELIRLLQVGSGTELGESCARLKREHREHAGYLARPLALLRLLVSEPEHLSEVRAELERCLLTLREALELHLAEEERQLFPALTRGLSPVQLQAAVVAMQARRSVQ